METIITNRYHLRNPLICILKHPVPIQKQKVYYIKVNPMAIAKISYRFLKDATIIIFVII
ncbi:hypothetical protein LEG80045_29410 [Legionella pneumophila]|nr:hypothetical protein LEG80045_29410 [Legionella pneumophila]